MFCPRYAERQSPSACGVERSRQTKAPTPSIPGQLWFGRRTAVTGEDSLRVRKCRSASKRGASNCAGEPFKRSFNAASLDGRCCLEVSRTSGKSLALLLAGENEDWWILRGIVRQEGEALLLDHDAREQPFVIQPDWLDRINPTPTSWSNILIGFLLAALSGRFCQMALTGAITLLRG